MNDPLSIACPLCRAPVNQQCEDIISGGFMGPRARPHKYRQLIANEDVAETYAEVASSMRDSANALDEIAEVYVPTRCPVCFHEAGGDQ